MIVLAADLRSKNPEARTFAPSGGLEMNNTEPEERMSELKRDIALNRYNVDSRVVADAILTKVQLVKRCRMALASAEADRIQMGSLPSRPGH